jgi:hypothetical protein
MEFDNLLNEIDPQLKNNNLKDVIRLIASNKKLSDQLILNTIRENYNSADYWKYIIEKLYLSNDFILDNMEHLNFEYILKFQKLDEVIKNNYKFINHMIEKFYVNNLVMYQTLSFEILDYLILNGFIDLDFWNIISQYQQLNNEFIRKYDDKLNWKLISTYQVIDLELLTDYLDKIDWTNIPLNISASSLINDNTIQLFDKYPIWENITCLTNLSNNVLFRYFDKLPFNAIINILSYRGLNHEFINTIIKKFDMPEVWKEISSNQYVSNEFIDLYIDKLDWSELSENYPFKGTDLTKYNKYIDYKKLSYNDNFSEVWLEILSNNKKTNPNVNNLDISFLMNYCIISNNNINFNN